MHISEGYDYFRLYIGKCDLHVGLIVGCNESHGHAIICEGIKNSHN